MTRIVIAVFLLLALCVPPLYASEHTPHRDDRAIAVLKSMSEYLAGLDKFAIKGTSLEDERLGNGLMVTSPIEIHLAVKRPGSLHIRQFDGRYNKDLHLHDGSLALHDSQTGYFATATVPAGLDAGLDYALQELAIDLPLADLIQNDAFTRLAGTSDPLIYVTDKSRVAGVDCHQLAIRVEGADVQLWIQEGEQPLPRRMIITSIWEGGSPRFAAVMDWDLDPKIAQGAFDFHPPDGAVQIQFEPAD